MLVLRPRPDRHNQHLLLHILEPRILNPPLQVPARIPVQSYLPQGLVEQLVVLYQVTVGREAVVNRMQSKVPVLELAPTTGLEVSVLSVNIDRRRGRRRTHV